MLLNVNDRHLLCLSSALSPIRSSEYLYQQNGNGHLADEQSPPSATWAVGYDNPVLDANDMHNGALGNGFMSTPPNGQ